jgi:hypothetical protein
MRSLEQLEEVRVAGDHLIIPEFALSVILRSKTNSVDVVEQMAKCVPDRDAM